MTVTLSLAHSLTDSLTHLRYCQDVTQSRSENTEPVASVFYASSILCHLFWPLPPFSPHLLTQLKYPPLHLPLQPAKIEDTSLYSPLRFWHSSSTIPFNPYPLPNLPS